MTTATRTVPRADTSTDDERIRLNMVVNGHVRDRIERLQALSEGASLTDVIRRALAIYEEILVIRDEGGKLVVENQGTREVIRII